MNDCSSSTGIPGSIQSIHSGHGCRRCGGGSSTIPDPGGEERVVAYDSKTLTQSEKNYCVTRKELFAVVKAMKHFQSDLYEQNFKIKMDHASLR